MAQPQLYDRIGVGYQQARVADHRVAAQVHDALGDAATVLNVGAGTGNYEPNDRMVVAADANKVMLGQRTSAAPTVQSFAEALPFADQSFDAAMATFTVHHWTDREAGALELGRVSHRQVVLLYDTAITSQFWLGEYFEAIRHEADAGHPKAEWLAGFLDLREVRTLRIPSDCTDGFAGAYWRRPERYLDPQVQAGMSVIARLPKADQIAGTQRLQTALDSGEWHDRFGHLLDLDEYDMGYRLAICGD